MGELSALGSAFLSAVNGVLLRASSGRSTALTLNAIQYTAAALVSLAFLLPFGFVEQAVHLPGIVIVELGVSALIGLAGGDTLYIHSLRVLGIARAFPLSYSLYVLLAFLTAAVILGEPLGLTAVAGAALVLCGVSCIAFAQNGHSGARVTAGLTYGEGVLAATGAAVCWTTSIFLLRLALTDVGVLAANAIRLPVVALALLTAAAFQQEGLNLTALGRRALVMVTCAGILGIALGGLTFLFAVQTAGAAKTAALNSSSPLFVVLLSLAFFRQEITKLVMVGTVLCVAGIALLA